MFSLGFNGMTSAALRGFISPQSLGPVFVLTMGEIDPGMRLSGWLTTTANPWSSAANGYHYGVHCTDFSLRPAVPLVQSGSRHELQKETSSATSYHASMTGTKEVSSKTPCKELAAFVQYLTPERVAQAPWLILGARELSNWSLGSLEVNLGVGDLERDAIEESMNPSMPTIVTLPAMCSRVRLG
jgi:hypothetical protein